MNDVITIDGPSGSGKSTVSKMLAERLGYAYLDTGALYRAVAWKVREEDVDPEDEAGLRALLDTIEITFQGERIFVNGTEVTSQIREPDVGELSSRISAKPLVRTYLFDVQRTIGMKGKVVIEGRDIGTAILPEAKNKFYLDASIDERARRRYGELKEKTGDVSLHATLEAMENRDRRDSTRQEAPLKRTDEMMYIDTSSLTIDEVVSRVIRAIERG
jgi:cytidylate kinase